MRHKDRVIIENYPEATIDYETPKAICLHFDGRNPKTNVWIPKKIINIKQFKPINLNYRDVTQFKIDLPEWFLNTTDMRLLLIPTN
tara:strand:+ start:343 stop:600 length:258 start_codon:yes stop_codon:yes gene_type:complete